MGTARSRRLGSLVAAALALAAAPKVAMAGPVVAPETQGARLIYLGLEPSFRIASSQGDASPMLGVGPNFEIQFTPRWSLQVGGAYAFGVGTAYPKAWWEFGVRGWWRPLPAQAVGVGLSIARADESRNRFEDIGPQVDLSGVIWEFDADPFRFGPTARLAATLHEGSVYGGLGIFGQFGWGPIRYKDPDNIFE